MSTLAETGDTSALLCADASPTLVSPEWRYRKTVLYRAVNTINGKAYVGITLDLHKRKQKHLSDARKGSTTAFHRAIRKYGEHSFQWRVVATASCFAVACALEKLAVHLGLGNYNMTAGGEGVPGRVMTETAKNKWRASVRAAGPCPRRAEALRGKTRSPEQRARIAAGMRKHHASNPTTEERLQKYVAAGKATWAAKTDAQKQALMAATLRKGRQR